ncbi:MAG: hypothetical protein U9P79_00460, partial [Candidatus Cloacimonadota bacterium]|nr:hypothetical protein [Candidatus Cloacimonadota bacterium]
MKNELASSLQKLGILKFSGIDELIINSSSPVEKDNDLLSSEVASDVAYVPKQGLGNEKKFQGLGNEKTSEKIENGKTGEKIENGKTSEKIENGKT